jgi:hypothetical protein
MHSKLVYHSRQRKPPDLSTLLYTALQIACGTTLHNQQLCRTYSQAPQVILLYTPTNTNRANPTPDVSAADLRQRLLQQRVTTLATVAAAQTHRCQPRCRRRCRRHSLPHCQHSSLHHYPHLVLVLGPPLAQVLVWVQALKPARPLLQVWVWGQPLVLVLVQAWVLVLVPALLLVPALVLVLVRGQVLLWVLVLVLARARGPPLWV